MPLAKPPSDSEFDDRGHRSQKWTGLSVLRRTTIAVIRKSRKPDSAVEISESLYLMFVCDQ